MRVQAMFGILVPRQVVVDRVRIMRVREGRRRAIMRRERRVNAQVGQGAQQNNPQPRIMHAFELMGQGVRPQEDQ